MEKGENSLMSESEIKLLVIDDLGVESQTDYALEIIFSVIDGRYKNGQPLIITTNLTLEQLENPAKVEQSRIYDRILEMCFPIKVQGESLRKIAYLNKIETTKELLQ